MQNTFMLPMVCQLCNAEYFYAANNVRGYPVYCQRCANCVTQSTFILPTVCQLYNAEYTWRFVLPVGKVASWSTCYTDVHYYYVCCNPVLGGL